MNTNNIIEVAIPSDQNYYPGLLVTVCSMAKRIARGCALRLHILDGGILDDSYDQMVRAAQSANGGVEFIRHKVAELDYSAFPLWKGNRMTYVRLVLPSLLPDSDYVIYADSDMLWCADITKLWAERRSDCILRAVHDTLGAPIESPWFAKRQLPFYPENYFNNGLLIINLKSFRQEDMVGQAVDFLHKHPDVIFADQSVFNALMGGRVKLLEPDWNFVARDMKNEDKREPFVIHYVAEACPWRTREYCGVVRPYLAAWLKEYAEASGADIRAAYARFGFKYRPTFDSVVMFIAKHKWLRRVSTVPFRMIGLRKVSNFINGASTRCGKLMGTI